MALIALGINHDTASVDVREKVAFAPEQMLDALHSFCDAVQLDEVIILSTCNRTEIFTEGRSEHVDAILHWLASFHSLHVSSFHSNHYCYQGDAALHHMMKVASGLDSMILGEPQILGQMKSAYAVAQEAGTISGVLNYAMQHTFNYAKKVRTQTAIGENPVSVAFAAVHLSQRIFSDLATTAVLLVGAGDTINLVARHLLEKKVKKIIVANRTLTHAQELAQEYGAEAILLSDIPARLAEVDMVFSSTASQLPILGKGAVEQAIRKRKRRPMFMMDIAVPRDIEPEVSELKDVYLYTVDDLRDIIDENKKARLSEVVKADLILAEGVAAFNAAQRVSDVVPIIRAYREQAENIRDDELDKAFKQLAAGVDSEKVLENLARGLTNKLIHAPVIGLKQASEAGDKKIIAEFAQWLNLPDSSYIETDE
jgi:glutamyl-tRNA reductase